MTWPSQLKHRRWHSFPPDAVGNFRLSKKIAINPKGNKDHLTRQDDYRKFNDAFNGKDMKKKTNPWDDPALEK